MEKLLNGTTLEQYAEMDNNLENGNQESDWEKEILMKSKADMESKEANSDSDASTYNEHIPPEVIMHIVAMQHLNELKQYALHNDNCKIMLLCTEIETEVQNNQLNKQNRQTSILDFFNKK